MFLFDSLLKYTPVNNYGHVQTLPPFYGASSQYLDIMTCEICFKINHLSEKTNVCIDELFSWAAHLTFLAVTSGSYNKDIFTIIMCRIVVSVKKIESWIKFSFFLFSTHGSEIGW